MNRTTHTAPVQPGRSAAIEAWDRANEPGVSCHADSIEWDMFLHDRERFIEALDSEDDDGPPADAAWLEAQAAHFEAMHSDVATPSASKLREVIGAMAIVGAWSVADIETRRAALVGAA